jgi:hypothetical protein
MLLGKVDLLGKIWVFNIYFIQVPLVVLGIWFRITMIVWPLAVHMVLLIFFFLLLHVIPSGKRLLMLWLLEPGQSASDRPDILLQGFSI